MQRGGRVARRYAIWLTMSVNANDVDVSAFPQKHRSDAKQTTFHRIRSGSNINHSGANQNVETRASLVRLFNWIDTPTRA
jgi:hypothetical protein